MKRFSVGVRQLAKTGIAAIFWTRDSGALAVSVEQDLDTSGARLYRIARFLVRDEKSQWPPRLTGPRGRYIPCCEKYQGFRV